MMQTFAECQPQLARKTPAVSDGFPGLLGDLGLGVEDREAGESTHMMAVRVVPNLILRMVPFTRVMTRG